MHNSNAAMALANRVRSNRVSDPVLANVRSVAFANDSHRAPAAESAGITKPTITVNQWRGILDCMSDGVALVDRDGRLIDHSQGLIPLADDTPERLCQEALRGLGKPLPWHTEESSPTDEIIWGWRSETTNRAFEMKAKPLEAAPEAIDLLIFHDVSDRQFSERMMRDWEQNGHAALIASSIGHELNNILVGLIGYTELAQMRMDDTEFMESVLGLYDQQCCHLRHLASNLLALRPSEKIEAAPVDLGQVVHSSVSILRHSSCLRPLCVHPEVDFDVPPVVTDRKSVQSMLALFLTQIAIESEEIVDTAVRVTSPDAKTTRLTIDIGPHGLTQAGRERLQRAHMQCEYPMSSEPIAIALRIAHRLRCRVTAETTPTKGMGIHIDFKSAAR